MHPNIPMLIPFPQPYSEPPQGEQPPARVRVAMAFLSYLSHKTDSKIAVNDISIEQFTGQSLTTDEEIARDAACQMLTHYFNGKLPRDVREQYQAEKSKQRGAGRLIACFACVGAGMRPQRECVFCKGLGQVLVYPTAGEQEELM